MGNKQSNATTWTSDRLARRPNTTPTPTPTGMWVNILNRWFVMSQEVKTVGDALTVVKKDGSTQEVIVEQIVGAFEDKVIYKVRKDAVV